MDHTDKVLELTNELSHTIFDWCRQHNYPQYMGLVAVKLCMMNAYDRLDAVTLCRVDQAAHVLYTSTDKQDLASMEPK